MRGLITKFMNLGECDQHEKEREYEEEEREYRKGIECKEWNGCWGYEAVLEALSGLCTLVVVFRGCVHWYDLSPTHVCVLH